MEGVFAGDKSQMPTIVKVAVNGSYIVYGSDGTFGAGWDRPRIVSHTIQHNTSTGLVGSFHSFNKYFVYCTEIVFVYIIIMSLMAQ